MALPSLEVRGGYIVSTRSRPSASVALAAKVASAWSGLALPSIRDCVASAISCWIFASPGLGIKDRLLGSVCSAATRKGRLPYSGCVRATSVRGATAPIAIRPSASARPLVMYLTNSHAAAACVPRLAMAQTQPMPPVVKGLPSTAGMRHVATLWKRSGIGAAPRAPQSNSHDHVPLVVMARSPRGKALYLVGTQGFGAFNHLTGSKPSLAIVA